MEQLTTLIKTLGIEELRKINTIAESAGHCIAVRNDIEDKQELLQAVNEIVDAAREGIKGIAMRNIENDYQI